MLATLASAVSAKDTATSSEELAAQIRGAIEASDYDALAALVNWEGTGEIKKRIVRFHLNRNLGRPIKSVSTEPLGEHALDAVLATGKYAPNMAVTERVTVVFDEATVNESGKLPTSVFLVGNQGGIYRIGLVNRTFDEDDDDD